MTSSGIIEQQVHLARMMHDTELFSDRYSGNCASVPCSLTASTSSRSSTSKDSSARENALWASSCSHPIWDHSETSFSSTRSSSWQCWCWCTQRGPPRTKPLDPGNGNRWISNGIQRSAADAANLGIPYSHTLETVAHVLNYCWNQHQHPHPPRTTLFALGAHAEIASLEIDL